MNDDTRRKVQEEAEQARSGGRLLEMTPEVVLGLLLEARRDQDQLERYEAERIQALRLLRGRESAGLLVAAEAVAGLQACGHANAMRRYDEEEGCNFCQQCELERAILVQREGEAVLAARLTEVDAERLALREALQQVRGMVEIGRGVMPLLRAIDTALASDSGALLLAELEAARAVVVVLREVLARKSSMSALTVAVAAYDKAVKARSG